MAKACIQLRSIETIAHVRIQIELWLLPDERADNALQLILSLIITDLEDGDLIKWFIHRNCLD